MMPLGSSAGRSARNRNADGARRRATQRERAAIDPPMDQMITVVDPEPERTYQLTPRGERVVSFVTWASMVGMLALMVFILGTWFGLWLA